MTSPAPRVTMIDPSLFTAPYDRALAAALAARGAAVELLGRPLRPGEPSLAGGGFAFDPCFYRLAEGAAARLPERLRAPLKALEHLAGTAGLPRRLRGNRPDVVHLQWLPLPWWDARIVRRLQRLAPVVLTVHDTEPLRGAPSSSLQLGGGTAWRAADALVVHTAAGANRLRRAGIPDDRVHVVSHPPLPLPAGCTATPFRPPVRTLVVVGELKPYKGLDVLLGALGRLGPGAPLRLLVAGRPRMDVEPLRRLAHELALGGRVEWRLRRLDDTELAEVLLAADAFVLPYRRADASGVLSLVLALGRPMLASRVGAMAEVLEDGGSALLVPPDDPAALAEALGRLTDDATATRLAASSGIALRRLGSWDQAAARHLELYRQLIADRTSRTMRR